MALDKSKYDNVIQPVADDFPDDYDGYDDDDYDDDDADCYCE